MAFHSTDQCCKCTLLTVYLVVDAILSTIIFIVMLITGLVTATASDYPNGHLLMKGVTELGAIGIMGVEYLQPEHLTVQQWSQINLTSRLDIGVQLVDTLANLSNDYQCCGFYGYKDFWTPHLPIPSLAAQMMKMDTLALPMNVIHLVLISRHYADFSIASLAQDSDDMQRLVQKLLEKLQRVVQKLRTHKDIYIYNHYLAAAPPMCCKRRGTVAAKCVASNKKPTDLGYENEIHLIMSLMDSTGETKNAVREKRKFLKALEDNRPSMRPYWPSQMNSRGCLAAVLLQVAYNGRVLSILLCIILFIDLAAWNIAASQCRRNCFCCCSKDKGQGKGTRKPDGGQKQFNDGQLQCQQQPLLDNVKHEQSSGSNENKHQAV